MAAFSQVPSLVAGVGHSDSVEVKAFGLDGKIVITRSNDGTAKIWETRSGRMLLTIPSSCPIAISPDTRFLATCESNLTVSVWKLETARKVVTLKLNLTSPEAVVEALTFSAGMTKIAGVSSDQGTPDSEGAVWLHTWEVATGRGRRQRLNRPGMSLTSPILSPDGSFLLGVSEDAAGMDARRSLEVWSVASGTRRYARALPDDEESKNYVFSPDSSLVASLAWDEMKGGGIRLREVATGKQFKMLTHHRQLMKQPVFSAKGGLLACAESDTDVKLWDIKSGRSLDRAFHSSHQFYSLALSPDGRTLAAGGRRSVTDPVGVIQLWDTATGAAHEPLRGHRGAIFSLVFSPDATTLATAVGEEGGDDRTAKLWSVEHGIELRTLEGYLNTSKSVVFSPDSRLLIVQNRGPDITSNTWNPSFVLWDLINEREPRTYEGEFLAFSRDSKTLLIRLNRPQGCNSQPTTVIPQTFQLDLVDVATNTKIRTLGGPFCDLERYALSPDATMLAIGGGFANNGKEVVFRLWDIPGGKQLRDIRTGTRDVPFVHFSLDGKSLIAADDESRSIKVWSVETGELERTLHHSPQWENPVVHAAAFGPDGKIGAISGDRTHRSTLRVWSPLSSMPLFERRVAEGMQRSVTFSHDGTQIATTGSRIDLWNAATGRRIQSLNVAAPADTEYSVSARFSSDDKTLITVVGAGSYERVQLWDVSSGAELPMLKQQPGELRAAAVSNDGNKLATLSTDGIVRIWSFRSGTLLASLIALDGGEWLALTPDGRFDGRPAAWARIFWRFSEDILNTAPVEIFFNEYFTPGLLPDAVARRLSPLKVAVVDRDRRQPTVELSLSNATGPGPHTTKMRRLAVNVVVTDSPRATSEAAGSGAKDVRLFHNGSLVKMWPGDVLDDRAGKVVLKADVLMVAGDNNLKAYAFNRDNVKSADAALSVEGDESLRRTGTLYVIAVGINNYPNTRYNLRYAFDDAEEFSAMVSSAQQSLGRHIKVIKLPNERATKANIMFALSRLAGVEGREPPTDSESAAQLSEIRPAEPEDAVLIYFSGHGKSLGDRFYLIQHDIVRPEEVIEDENGRLPRGISDEELEEVFLKIGAGQMLLVIDACNSGQVLGAKGLRYGPMNSKGLAQLAYEKGMYVLAASQGYQAAWEVSELGHGLLTYALIQEGLRNRKADVEPPAGTVHVREWLNYATNRVPDLQVSKMRQCKDAVRDCAFVDGEDKTREVEDRSIQQPRIFYRREEDAQSWVISRLPAVQTP